LPFLDLKASLEEELISNPLLEEFKSYDEAVTFSPSSRRKSDDSGTDFRISLITKKMTLQDVLLRQLGMFVNTDEELRIGQEIIGNIDEDGYLQAKIESMADSLSVACEEIERVLKIIQRFEPTGVAARTLSECLLIQLDSSGEREPLISKIVECHLEDVAKKNYTNIAKALKQPQDKIETLIKKILRLNPKPGRNYSAEEAYHIVPDVIIDQNGDDLEISLNDEHIPTLRINRTYREMLKRNNLDEQTREFLADKLHRAIELVRAIAKRRQTLRKVLEIIVDIQQDALKNGLSNLKPLTYAEVAKRLDIHESTVSRAVMNKYVQTSWGIIALKDLFSSHVHDINGQTVSSSLIKGFIRGIVEKENRRSPLSDQDISDYLARERNLKISRRTVAKYREELKIPSSIYRRVR
jgi:RNA polymerase sigma-54 factor